MKIIFNALCISAITVIAAQNAFASEDILSVDKTLIIQIVIFLSAIFMLNNLLFKPLFDLDSSREKLTTGTSSEAKELKLKAEQAIRDYKEQINVARIQVQDERNEIRKNAQTSASEMIARAKSEVNSMLDDARISIEKESKEIREKIRPEIELIAREVASRLINKEI